jgi:hypothetical protein
MGGIISPFPMKKRKTFSPRSAILAITSAETGLRSCVIFSIRFFGC